MDSVLALDIGTSGCRAAVCFSDGRIGPVAARTFPPVAPGERAEQDPDELLAQSTLCVHEAVRLSGAQPRLLVPSTILHTLVLFDADLNVLAPMSIWSDSRAGSTAREMQEMHERAHWVESTGCISSASYPVYRLIHLQRTGAYQRLGVERIGSFKAFLLHRLAAVFAEDRTIASGSGFFNLQTHTWDSGILKLAELPPDSLPRVVGSATVFPVRAGILPDSIAQIAAGGGDGALAHLGSVGRSPGVFSLTLGTSTAVRAGLPEPASRTGRLVWSYAIDEEFFLSGRAANNGGNVADHYFRENVPGFSGDWHGVDAQLEQERNVPLFAPFLFPERNESYIREKSYGFDKDVEGSASAASRMRGVLEGIGFHAASLFEDLASLTPAMEVRLSGSLTRLTFIQKLFSTILPVHVRILPDETAVLRGCAGIFLPMFAETPSVVPRQIPGLSDAVDVRARYQAWKDRFIWDRH